jgi:hypothetical protein
VNQNNTKTLTAYVAQTKVQVKPKNMPRTKNLPPVGRVLKWFDEGLRGS